MVRFGLAAIAASFVLLASGANASAATAVNAKALDTLTATAQHIDAAAAHGDWPAANTLTKQLGTAWNAQRPSVLHGLRGQAHAQSFDASLKWLESAVAQRSARNVHDAAVNVGRSVHELKE